jgi:WD40 repeat protein
MIANNLMDSSWDEETGDFQASERTRPALANAWTLSGLTMLALVAGGLAWVASDVMKGPVQPTTRARFRHLDSSLGSVAFAPDGKALALGQLNGLVEIQDLNRGNPREIEAGPGTISRSVAFSPDGQTLASGGQGNAVRLWDVLTGNPTGSLEGHASPVRSLAFSHDGKILASGSLDGSVKLWDVANGQELTKVAGHSSDIRGLAFAPDGKTLASASLDGSVKLWDVANGRELASVRDKTRRVYSLAFAPNGKTLAFGLGPYVNGPKGQIVLWNLAGGREALWIINDLGYVSIAFSPDGTILAGAGNDRAVKLWDVATGRELACLTGHEGFITSIAFSPDGQFIATGGYDSLVGLFPIDPAKLKAEPRKL